MTRAAAVFVMCVGAAVATAGGLAQTPVAQDPRLGQLRDLDAHFPFTPSATKEAWEERAARLRRQVRVALGLWPWPSRTPLNAVVHGTVTREGYTVGRVFFESVPGHFVTGSLYRPTGRSGRLPGVLSPHGHWPGGRFQDIAEKERRQQLASGAERFDNGARHVLQARAVQLARMGTVVLLFDMIGYADSVQIPQEVAHSPRGRPRADTDGLFFSTGAELRLQSILGLQMWNAVRALDFLTSLPDVDPSRIAVTGASGGGTQTFLLGAIDERPAVAFPAVMVSARMQGGCTCENAHYLRIGTGNVELAALFAPKPLGMTAADDWTRTMPADGFPQLQAHYDLFGVRDRVQLFPSLQFGHNYNHVSRAAMYGWLNRHLGLGVEEPVLESDFVPLSRQQATVWTGGHPAPAGGEAHERAVTRWWQQDTDGQLARLRPPQARSLEGWRELVSGFVEAIVSRPPGDTPRLVQTGARAGGTAGAVEVGTGGRRAGVLSWTPAGAVRGVTVVTAGGGIRALVDGDQPGPVVRALLAEGQRVVAVDVLGQDGTRGANRLVANRASAAYTFGYNLPLVVERAQDVMAALVVAREAAAGARLTLAALDGPATLWAALAAAHGASDFDAAAFVTDRMRFADVSSFEDPSFLPGGAKYGDLPALIALSAPRPVWIAGEPADGPALIRAIYDAAGAPRRLVVSRARGERARADLVRWIARGQ